MNALFKYMFGSAAILVAFALVGTVPVAGLYYSPADKIAANLQATRLRSINEVISADLYDNDILQDPITIFDENLLPGDTAATIYIARKQTAMVAAIFETVAPDGYSGSIRMLVGVNATGDLTGVRILEHGGDFDQLTGATITPRAVVKAIKRCLVYYNAHKTELGAPTEPQKNLAYGKQ